MSVPETCRAFWSGYVAVAGADVESRFTEAFHFCHTAELADPLADLVVAGHKRATAGLLWSYEAEDEAIPEVGQISIVTRFDGTPVAVIETTSVTVTAFDEVSAEFAQREGEGDKSLRYWREAHWAYFTGECQRLGREPQPSMPVVCEEFEVVYPVN